MRVHGQWASPEFQGNHCSKKLALHQDCSLEVEGLAFITSGTQGWFSISGCHLSSGQSCLSRIQVTSAGQALLWPLKIKRWRKKQGDFHTNYEWNEKEEFSCTSPQGSI